MSAEFRHGNPLMVDYTPGADAVAGDVIAFAATTAAVIYHRDATSGVLAAVALRGGVYEVTAAEAVAIGAVVKYVNATGKVAAIGDLEFGVAVTAAAADGDKIMVHHDPYA